MAKIDMTGWVMKEHNVLDSKLTVLHEDKEYKIKNNIKQKQTYWLCICECGNKVVASGTNIRKGIIRSCGCLYKDLGKIRKKDITGKTFGLLKVIEADNNYKQEKEIKNTKAYWKCECVCGNKITVSGDNLRNGHTQSCGCMISIGEYKIRQLLLENNISFKTQWSFEECRFPDSKKLAKYDFYINNDFLLEFDGKQHFLYYQTGWNKKENFIKTQEHDNFKNNWCKNNNIPLKRIPYWELNNLTIEDILGDKFLI